MPNPNEAVTPADPVVDPAAVAATPPAADPPADPDAGLMEAVNSAIAGATPQPAEEPPADPDAPPADAPPAEATPADPDPNKPVEPAAAATPPADAPPARPSDEFGELDASVPQKTRERFAAVKTQYDAVVGERDQAVAIANDWTRMVDSTGATPEQFGMAVTYLRDACSGTPEGMRRAFETMMGEAKALAEALGEDLPGVTDALATHPDLQEKVRDGIYDRADAVEIAKSRAALNMQRAHAQTVADRQAAEAQTRTAFDAAASEALGDIRAFGAERKANDPTYAARMQVIGPRVQEIQATLPPSRWYAEITKAYHGAPVAAPPPKDPRAAIPSGPQPQRQTINPTAGGTTPTAAPASPEDAAMQVLARMGVTVR